MKINRFVSLGIFFFCLLASASSSFSISKGKNTLQDVYLTSPFDLNTEKIPKSVKGHDIVRLYKILENKSKGLTKKEFETSAEYEKRLEESNEGIIFGSINKYSLLSFIVKPSRCSYDADNKILSIHLNTGPVLEEGGGSNRTRAEITIKENEFRKETVGQNAFGVKVPMTELRRIRFSLSVHNFQEFGFNFADYGQKTFLQKVNIPIVEAKKTKDSIFSLAIVKLTDPPTSSGVYYSKAKIDFPIEVYEKAYYLNVILIEIWTIDGLTGKILDKSKPVSQ